jgi:hypothetical protein
MSAADDAALRQLRQIHESLRQSNDELRRRIAEHQRRLSLTGRGLDFVANRMMGLPRAAAAKIYYSVYAHWPWRRQP